MLFVVNKRLGDYTTIDVDNGKNLGRRVAGAGVVDGEIDYEVSVFGDTEFRNQVPFVPAFPEANDSSVHEEVVLDQGGSFQSLDSRLVGFHAHLKGGRITPSSIVRHKVHDLHLLSFILRLKLDDFPREAIRLLGEERNLRGQRVQVNLLIDIVAGTMAVVVAVAGMIAIAFRGSAVRSIWAFSVAAVMARVAALVAVAAMTVWL